MSDLDLLQKIKFLPVELKQEAIDFIEFLSHKVANSNLQEPKAGLAKGLIEMLPNFDDPIDEFKEYM